jgi:hypothetical protein
MVKKAKKKAKKKPAPRKKREEPEGGTIMLPVVMGGRLKKEWEYLRHDHSQWMAINYKKTLVDLLSMMKQCLEQCGEMESSTGDALIQDTDDIPEPLASELACYDNSEDDCTFSYRYANIEDEIGRIETIIEGIGKCTGWSMGKDKWLK